MYSPSQIHRHLHTLVNTGIRTNAHLCEPVHTPICSQTHIHTRTQIANAHICNNILMCLDVNAHAHNHTYACQYMHLNTHIHTLMNARYLCINRDLISFILSSCYYLIIIIRNKVYVNRPCKF